jgi:hypothetical protein
MLMNTEIIRIIRAALDGDTQNVVVYARLLAKNSECVNDSLSRRIIKELNGTPIEDTIEDFE